MAAAAYSTAIPAPIMARPVRKTVPAFQDISDATRDDDSQLPKGTITVFFAREGEGVLKEVQQAFRRGGGRLKAIIERFKSDFDANKKLSRKASAGRLERAPVVADLAYDGLVLAHGLFLPPEQKLGIMFLPHNGGDLNPKSFALLEWAEPGQGLDVLVVRNKPTLSAAEKAALERIPSHYQVGNIGGSSANRNWWDVIEAVAFVVAYATAEAVCTIVLAARTEPHALSDAELKRLDPTVSAKKILEARRDALLKGAKRP